jgi:hypothetical protein
MSGREGGRERGMERREEKDRKQWKKGSGSKWGKVKERDGVVGRESHDTCREWVRQYERGRKGGKGEYEGKDGHLLSPSLPE